MEFKMNLKKNFINKITNKYIDNKELTITGKILHYIQDIDIFSFFCTVNKSTSLNPFSSDIYFNFEFKDQCIPYVQILNDFINPTLNDGRNIYYCLTKKHKYIFDKDYLDDGEKIFYELIDNIKNFLICLKENIQINAFVFYGDYEIKKIYKINELILNKSAIKFYRIIHIDNNKDEQMLYVVITQLYFLILEPEKTDMSLATLIKAFAFKDYQFAFEEKNPNKKKEKIIYTLKIMKEENFNESLNVKFYLYENDKIKDNLSIKYIEFRSTLFQKKSDIDFSKYKIVIKNYKPLFNIENKKTTKLNKYKIKKDDYKSYIAYYEELYNYYKDFKDEKNKERIKTFVENLTYFCVDFISFYDSDPQEVEFYRKKMEQYYINENNKDNDNEISNK